MLSRRRATHSGYPVEIIVGSETHCRSRESLFPLPETGNRFSRRPQPLLARRYYLADKVSAGMGEQIHQLGRDSHRDRGVTLGRLNRRNIVTVAAAPARSIIRAVKMLSIVIARRKTRAAAPLNIRINVGANAPIVVEDKSPALSRRSRERESSSKNRWRESVAYSHWK